MKKKEILGEIVNISGRWYKITEGGNEIIYTPLDPNRAYSILNTTKDARTVKQNASMWQYVTILATALNDAGLSIQKVMTIELMWSKDSVMEHLWKVIQVAMYKKKSTTSLKKNEVTEVHRYLDLKMQEKGISRIDFPSEESMCREHNREEA